MTQTIFQGEVARLRKAEFLDHVSVAVTEALLQKIKGKQKKQRGQERSGAKPVVIPHVHRVFHNMERVGSKYGVPAVFSAPCKLAKMYPKVNSGCPATLVVD